MAYYERDYYREEQRPQTIWPKLGKVCKVALIAYAVVNLLLLFVSGNGDIPGAAMGPLLEGGTAGPIFYLAGHSFTLMPHGQFGPAPWKILTAVFIDSNIFGILMTCIFTFWLVGSSVEKSLGFKRFLIFVIVAAIVPYAIGSLIESTIWRDRAVAFGGAGPVTAAVFMAALVLFGNEKSMLLGISFKVIILVLMGLSVIFSLQDYFGDYPGMIESLPAFLFGGGWGYGYVKYLESQGVKFESPTEEARRKAMDGPQEDYLEFARRFSDTAASESSEKTSTATAKRAKLKSEDLPYDEAEAVQALEALTELGMSGLSRAQKSLVKKIHGSEEQRVVDALLDRISKEGISVLGADEKKILERASKKRNRET